MTELEQLHYNRTCNFYKENPEAVQLLIRLIGKDEAIKQIKNEMFMSEDDIMKHFYNDKEELYKMINPEFEIKL